MSDRPLTRAAIHRPSSRWTAIIWLGLTSLIVLASEGGFLGQVVEAYWAGVNSYQPATTAGPPLGSPNVATGSGNPQTGIGGQPIQPGSPPAGTDGGIGTGNSTIYNPATRPDLGVGAPAGSIGSGGPFALGQWRYGRAGHDPGELVG